MKAKNIPVKLFDLPHPPKELFYRGTWNEDIFQNCVAVVGSRRMTEYGKRVLEKLIPQLVFSGKTVVSGFMYGVDQYAHKATLENGGKTIAVLGWGINVPLGERDFKLADEIVASGGIILSEWENQTAAKWTFPARNRIVSGLSSEIYVVEAEIKSGTMITVKLAETLGKKIYAVPGPQTSVTSEGANLLIRENRAIPWHYS